jgi:FKBP-type peptidyl-prolyl cis-trans isomerase FkpA
MLLLSMKLKNILAVLMLGASVQVVAQSSGELKRLPDGTQYKFFRANAGPKPKVNDVITFNFIHKTDKDSLLFSSFDAGRPMMMQITASENPADLMNLFPLLSANDSVLVRVPADSIFRTADAQRPEFLPKGSHLNMIIRMEKIQSMEEIMAQQRQEAEANKQKEGAVLDKYATDHKLKVAKTASGLRYVITQASAKPKAAAGDTIYVNYTGKLLDGKVFDTSIEALAKTAGVHQPGRPYEPLEAIAGASQFIEGWNEALSLLPEGSKATLLIPSDLAYGPEGTYGIPPNTPLVFEMEIVRVKKPGSK